MIHLVKPMNNLPKGYTPAEAKAKLQAELGAYIDFQYNGEFIPEVEYQELKAYLIKIRQEKTTGKQDQNFN